MLFIVSPSSLASTATLCRPTLFRWSTKVNEPLCRWLPPGQKWSVGNDALYSWQTDCQGDGIPFGLECQAVSQEHWVSAEERLRRDVPPDVKDSDWHAQLNDDLRPSEPCYYWVSPRPWVLQGVPTEGAVVCPESLRDGVRGGRVEPDSLEPETMLQKVAARVRQMIEGSCICYKWINIQLKTVENAIVISGIVMTPSRPASVWRMPRGHCRRSVSTSSSTTKRTDWPCSKDPPKAKNPPFRYRTLTIGGRDTKQSRRKISSPWRICTRPSSITNRMTRKVSSPNIERR